MPISHDILIIGHVWPEPKSSAAGTRMMQLIDIFKEFNFTVAFACAAQSGEHRASLDDVTEIAASLNDPDFDVMLKDLNPRIVVFDRFIVEEQYGWRVSRMCPNAVRVLNTEDLHSLRKSRQKAVLQDREHTTGDILGEELALRELASIYRCDLSLMVSEFEMDVLIQQFKIDKSILFYLPILVEAQKTIKSYYDRADFMFIGNFLHKPNHDAVLYLKNGIWPLIRSKVKANLHIYGAYAPQSILSLHKPEDRFFIRGRAEDAQEVIEHARVMVAPLRFGAGIKGKLLEAMQYGTPSVTTMIGAEGISKGRWNGYVCHDPAQFADAAVSLYHDEKRWNEAQQTGYEILATRFARENFIPAFSDKLRAIADNLYVHRQANFIGKMLQFHSMRSTEYMSRWIECKSKTSVK